MPQHKSTSRGFRTVEFVARRGSNTLLQESSNVHPHLWVGDNHHLNKKQVKRLIAYLQYWLDKGELPG